MQVSLAHWNQDEAWGGFGGPHCMVKGGYSSLMEPLAATVDIRRGVAVSRISYNNQGVRVTSASGELTNTIITVLKPMFFGWKPQEHRVGLHIGSQCCFGNVRNRDAGSGSPSCRL